MRAKRLLRSEATARREIPAHLGQQLRTYYEFTQHVPLPGHLAELIQRLTQPAEDPNISQKPPAQ
jgi:hypothetical protein